MIGRLAQKELLSWKIDDHMGSGFCVVDCFGNPLQKGFDETPSAPAKSYYCDISLAQILLIDKILVGCEQDLKSCFLCLAQQVSIEKSAPALLPCSFYGVITKRIADFNRSSLIEKDQHLSRIRGGLKTLRCEFQNRLHLFPAKPLKHFHDLVYG